MITWGRLTDLIKKGERLDQESAFFFVFSQEDIQLFAIELNTGSPNISEYGQLFLHGVDSKGILLSKIGGDYSPVTKQIKSFENLPIDRITLYQEGDFYQSWEFIQKKDEFILKADTIKDGQDLQDRWGSDIIGLTDESINELASEVLPRIIDFILGEILS